MALSYGRKAGPMVSQYRVTERLYMTGDGRLVGEASPENKRLWAVPGQLIPQATADRYGLTEPAPDAEPEVDSTDSDTESGPVVESEPTWVCPDCGYEAGSAAGLGAHRRVHRTDTGNDEGA